MTENEVTVTNKLVATLEHLHLITRKLFTKKIQNVPLTGRLSYFITPWKKIIRIKKYCKRVRNPI